MTRLLACTTTLFVAIAAHAEWRYWAGDQGATRYSPLAQINRSGSPPGSNLPADVPLGRQGRPRPAPPLEYTPVVIGSVTYVTSPMLKAMALDAVTGKEIWRFDPFEGTDERPRDVNRGVALTGRMRKRRTSGFFTLPARASTASTPRPAS